MTAFTCFDCKQAKDTNKGSGPTGYAKTANDETICYDCCAIRDRTDMIAEGKAKLYLNDKHVSNWPGTLKFRLHANKIGRHNIAQTRYDVWFKGPDNAFWHGVTYGDNTQLCHCKRIKA